MASLLRKKISSVSSLFLSSRHHNLTILTPLLHFSTQIQQKDDLPFMAQYLISSFGFSEDRALRVANHRNLPIKTLDRPESVVRFLKDIGLTDIQINKAVSLTPRLLSLNVSNTLEPCRSEIISAGFTEKTFHLLIRFNPLALTLKNLLSRLQFWRNFVGNNEEKFLKLVKARTLITMDIGEKVTTGINLLREFGLSNEHIAKFIVNTDHLLVQSPESIKLLFEQIEKLGFRRGSKMFLEGLITFGSMKKVTIDRKLALFRTTYGWSEEDFNLAIRKYPRIVQKSEEKIISTMDFLIAKVGLNPRSVALRPSFFSCSLERRLVPRHHVLTLLKSKGLKTKRSFQGVSVMTEKQFIEKYIFPYKEDMPELEEEYADACAGKLPLS